MNRLGIRAKLFLAILVFNVLLGAGAYWYVTRLARAQAEQTAVHEAQRLVAQMSAVREYYTQNVAANAQLKKMEVTPDYAKRPGALPLPATLVHEVNDALSKKEGYTIRLYSKHPFPHRRDGGARDDFEEQALRSLEANSRGTFWRREDYQGVPSVRFAAADVMVSNTCVNCHNSLPSSPKTDWKLGDVRGAIEVIVPIDHALASAEAGARNIVFAIAGGLFAILAAVAFITQRFLFAPLRKMADAATGISEGDLDQTIDYQARDEIGRLAGAFRGSIAYLKGVAGAADALRRGDLSVQLQPRGAKDVLSHSFQELRLTVEGLIAETGRLTQAARDGALDRRGDAARFQGAFRDLVQGMNETLDALRAPLDEATGALEMLAARDLSAGMRGDYDGDHAKIKLALNTAVEAMRHAIRSIATNMRALLLDDSRVMRVILGNILKGIGFEVVEASNGREGLERLAEGWMPDVVLADWNMPEMDGLEFVRKLRAAPPYDSVRVIMVTTETEHAQLNVALAAGANEYVMKPFTKEALVEKLQVTGIAVH